MKQDEIYFKDLSNKQLDYLKDIYIESRISAMDKDELIKFVKSIITDQIKGTVGNQEEKEAWKEMKEYFKDDFEEKLKEVIKEKGSSVEDYLNPEQEELEKRLDLIEKRKKEKKDNSHEDMW